jgi:hypothetical protein
MTTWLRCALGFFTIGISLAMPPVLGAEVTEEMHTFARIFATLEARNLTGYCAAMHGAPYIRYLNHVCQSAVLNKVKTLDDCSREKIAQQVKSDTAQCLAMSAAEFDATVLRGQEGRKAFAIEMTPQGIDGEALVEKERVKLR